jgi:transcriptional regulator GlxA family with amidase domain
LTALFHIFLQTNENFELLVEQQPLSRRQLERKFQQEIGLSPAHLKQLYRVKKARELIARNPAIQLIQVAHDCGFYDQAHFIRHFQKITGQTPGQYKQRKMSQIYNPRP